MKPYALTIRFRGYRRTLHAIARPSCDAPCSVPAPSYGENVSVRERVLQYRERDMIDMHAIGMLPGAWSDWRDVPTVAE